MTTSLILSEPNARFVSSEAEKRAMTKTRIINHALDLYRKYELQRELIEGFSSQTEEDLVEAMSDFDDYLRIVDSE